MPQPFARKECGEWRKHGALRPFRPFQGARRSALRPTAGPAGTCGRREREREREKERERETGREIEERAGS